MGAAKVILRYGAYLFIGGWMFFLGLLVGRGNAPVTFDTEGFQDRLETIARDFGSQKAPEEKIDLRFYDVLDDPVRPDSDSRKTASKEIFPAKEVSLTQPLPGNTDTIPLKTGLKAATLDREALKAFKASSTKTANAKAKSRNGKEQSRAVKKVAKITKKKTGQTKDLPESDKTAPVKENQLQSKGRYTIQVAAYKSFKDAVTQMSILEEKGFKSYRTTGEKDGQTWYRVRVGVFGSYQAAAAHADKLKKAKIDSMIIRRD